jgi:hypothetical protein
VPEPEVGGERTTASRLLFVDTKSPWACGLIVYTSSLKEHGVEDLNHPPVVKEWPSGLGVEPAPQRFTDERGGRKKRWA